MGYDVIKILLFRGIVERAFLNDWRFRILGTRYAIQHQYLESCNFGPNPNASKIYVISSVINGLLEQYGKRNTQVNHLEGENASSHFLYTNFL